ncbi:uncharacterized protein LOC129005542 [Macrosteles quadrilineatus]|uniref:uncharacterized protein LOC129002016 n=1 Tax=Macrosteles quadrilineatus TaxID=74068 RepID=UPI0023E2029F|nr:uncharacterized protein LOC129002016 [Macrosteles quadrilineatus]XP_054290424.1 uncharacterized protein LOC129005542 [Macrosteles quadrilineatus]
MPYIEAEPFLQEVNHATDYVKTALDTDEVVIFTDKIQRSAFIFAQDVLEGFEKPFKPYVFGQEPHAKEIEKLLEKMTDNAELPHIFYKKAYVAGSRYIGMQYESGELEERLGVEPYMVLPKMYPDETDYALRKAEYEKQIY